MVAKRLTLYNSYENDGHSLGLCVKRALEHDAECNTRGHER